MEYFKLYIHSVQSEQIVLIFMLHVLGKLNNGIIKDITKSHTFIILLSFSYLCGLKAGKGIFFHLPSPVSFHTWSGLSKVIYKNVCAEERTF